MRGPLCCCSLVGDTGVGDTGLGRAVGLGHTCGRMLMVNTLEISLALIVIKAWRET